MMTSTMKTTFKTTMTNVNVSLSPCYLGTSSLPHYSVSSSQVSLCTIEDSFVLGFLTTACMRYPIKNVLKSCLSCCAVSKYEVLLLTRSTFFWDKRTFFGKPDTPNFRLMDHAFSRNLAISEMIRAGPKSQQTTRLSGFLL